jgi:predicted CoA-binding protein
MSILVEEAQIAKILESARTIAVVGLSDKPWRPSFGVSAYMQKQGYHIIPVNPHIGEALGEPSYHRLEDVPGPIDIVNIFRRSEEVGPIVDTAIRLGARCIWMQEGVVDYDAAARAEAAGLDVVVNRCILKYHRRLAR